VLEAVHCPYVDVGIIGLPPQPGAKGPRFYASGREAPRFATLGQYGLDIAVLDGPIGAASALKMSYAGCTKGLIALGSAMILAATRAGAAEGLRKELERTQPELLGWLTRVVPGMYTKAYRFVGEMEELRDFVGTDHAEHLIYEGAAGLYARLAEDQAGEQREIQALDAFLKRKA
jgi:3-hydroxyisobutyrate dehydrogenase-like beta-hydroxyacid dehydrogenase